ncbi:MAG: DUF1127 domain-containing protein [Rhodovulum sp.]
MAFVTDVFTARGGFAATLARLAKTLNARAREYALRRATCRELSALDDRVLDDLGIRRDEIARIAAESARGA